MSAIRKLAVEAAGNGLLAPRISGRDQSREEREIHRHPRRQLLSLRQAESLLSSPDAATVKGSRDPRHSSRSSRLRISGEQPQPHALFWHRAAKRF
jgi:hypothetical protein